MGAGTQGMGSQSVETARKLRADAVRNRERVLAAAKAVFSAGGAEASLEAVARRAGVGIGTLYRTSPRVKLCTRPSIDMKCSSCGSSRSG